MPGFIGPDRLRQMIEQEDDDSFLVIDVRAPEQYRLDHIPGAVNIPLHEVEFQSPRLMEPDRVVFYCRNGVRSKVAAILAVDSGLDPEKAFTLEGGMAAYSGEILLDLPRLDLFEARLEPGAMASRAIELEKGAWRFYHSASKKGKTPGVVRFFEKMARFETEHARSLFGRLPAEIRQSRSFESYFDDCQGNILEGGKSFDYVLSLLAANSPDEDLLDMALEIETGAYDLYKQSAVLCESPLERSFFLGLAGDEKKHMALIAGFLSGI